MTSLVPSPLAPAADRRLAGLLATVLVHAVLVLAWQMARTPAPAPVEKEGPVMQWLRLPPPASGTKPAPVMPATVTPLPSRAAPPASFGRRPLRPAPAVPAATSATPAPVDAPVPIAREHAPAPATVAETPSRPDATAILENARRSVADIDRALRKQNKPLIVAPPDSPQLRMRQGMEQAHALAAPRLFEAPKVEELVNNTGDGARRTRVITGNKTYCITERSPVTNVEMIEMHGKIMLTNCPRHETPAKPQEWRTARD